MINLFASQSRRTTGRQCKLVQASSESRRAGRQYKLVIATSGSGVWVSIYVRLPSSHPFSTPTTPRNRTLPSLLPRRRARRQPCRRRSRRSWTAQWAPRRPTSGDPSPTGASSSRYVLLSTPSGLVHLILCRACFLFLRLWPLHSLRLERILAPDREPSPFRHERLGLSQSHLLSCWCVLNRTVSSEMDAEHACPLPSIYGSNRVLLVGMNERSLQSTDAPYHSSTKLRQGAAHCWHLTAPTESLLLFFLLLF